MTALIRILKLIGKVILWIIAIVFILLFVFLICPVFYEIKGEKYDKLNSEAKIRILLGIVSLKIDYNGNDADIIIKIFGRKINKNKKIEKTIKEKNVKKEVKKTEPANTVSTSKTEIKSKESVKKVIPEEIKKETPRKVIFEWESTENITVNPEVRKIKFSDIKEEKIEKANVEVKRIKMSEQKEEINQEADKASEEKEPEKLNLKYFIKMPSEERKKLINAVLKLVKSLLKGVKPKDFMLKGTLGFSDPSLTGKAVGAAWALNGMLDKRIEIEAAFDREVLEGECEIKGRIVPVAMMFYIIRFIVVKPVRDIIILLVKGDKNGK